MKTLFSKSQSQKNNLIQFNTDIKNQCKQNSNDQQKKMFSRKPQIYLKTTQNSSKIVFNKEKDPKLKKYIEIHQNGSETRLKKLLNQSMNLKFVSPKNSKSLQKSFMSHSMQQLNNARLSNPYNKNHQIQNFDNCKNNNYSNSQNKNFKSNVKLNISNLQTIIDSQQYQYQNRLYKKNSSYQRQKDQQTNCHQTTQQSPRGIQQGIFDFSSSCLVYSRTCEKECIQCLNLRDQIKILAEKNINLQSNLNIKEKQICQLQIKVQEISRLKKQIEDSKSKIQQEKHQNEFDLLTIRDSIQKQLKNLRNCYSKAVQDLKYKQIQNNINKRYRKQHSQLNIKFKQLEEKVLEYKQKVKFYKQKTFKCQKCQNLKRQVSHPNLSLKRSLCFKKEELKEKGLALIHKQKRYSEDSIFSLSLTSEQDE